MRPLSANPCSALNEAIHSEVQAPNQGSTENSTPLSTIWKQKLGVCQDFAHIGLSILRTAGLPARYVCGYIETDPPPNTAGTPARMIGAVATHAWIEVLVPGMVWVALDPTNRQWVNERYVAVSFGRDFRDATPLRGTFTGSGGQNMKVRVTMKRQRSKNPNAPAPGPPPLDRPYPLSDPVLLFGIGHLFHAPLSPLSEIRPLCPRAQP